MTNSDILNNLGIKALNPLQLAAKACNAPKIEILAPTGSGKTLAFVLAMQQRLHDPDRHVQALVLAPTRELVRQIADVIRRALPAYKLTRLYGGHKFDDELNSLAAGSDILVATPGRLCDHMGRNKALLASVSILVIDEYDKALELGFATEMRRICCHLKHLRLTILTSATALLQQPDFLNLTEAATLDFRSDTALNGGHLHIFHIEAPARDKLDLLVDLLRTLPDGSGTLVFVNHRESAERVYDRLKRLGVPVAMYHGGLDQQQREIALALLASDTASVLVTTDLGSRGLDIDNIDNVIHYHLPPTAENWTHRNGRTARMGADGNVYLITSEADNIPDYLVWDTEYMPHPKAAHQFSRRWLPLYFAAGRKEKLSKADIAGFLMQQGGLDKSQLGRIILADHYAIAAVSAPQARDVLNRVATLKIKNKKVKISLI